ncbi:hypothetical protein SESBI_24353 [Sesbania bispinosa]|nr:hypothetical protein SESBI_24353 [Sesbania bispinosa]
MREKTQWDREYLEWPAEREVKPGAAVLVVLHRNLGRKGLGQVLVVLHRNLGKKGLSQGLGLKLQK